MFHVKHTYFAGLKTLILSNTACLEPSFTLRREPARYALDLAPGSDRYDKPSPLRSPHKLSPRRLEWSSFFIESGLEVIQQDNMRELLSRSTPSSIKPRRRLHLNTRAPNASHYFEHTFHSHPCFCRQLIHPRNQNRRSNENRAALYCRAAPKIIKTLDKH